jgi:prepilin-type N-terminal cleavage/methylation domain-containing protein
MKKTNHGFSLIELLMVVVFIGAIVGWYQYYKGTTDKIMDGFGLASSILELSNLIESVNQKGNIVNYNKQYLSLQKGFPADMELSEGSIYYRKSISIGVNVIPNRLVASTAVIGKQSQGFFIKPVQIPKVLCVQMLSRLWEHFTLIERDGVFVKSLNNEAFIPENACGSTSEPKTLLLIKI